jgi:hypothetical protein
VAIAVTISRHRMLVSRTFALSTEHSRPPRRRAVSNPTRAMRRISVCAVAHRVEALVVARAFALPSAGLAEIDVAGQLADDHEVETLQRRRI